MEQCSLGSARQAEGPESTEGQERLSGNGDAAEAVLATSLARAQVKVGESVAADALRVRRLDCVAGHYFLVLFGPRGARTAAATVDVSSRSVEEWALLPGRTEHLTVDASAASNLARMPNAVVDLAWRPCRASRSPLYPMWRLRDPGGTRYVDQQGIVWTDLEGDGRGG